MAGYKVSYFVGSLATKSINRLLAQALVRLAPPELQMTEISFKGFATIQLRLRRELPSGRDRVQERDSSGRCRPIRHARVQPLDSGCVEECHRLGESA
jgi:hypothetical protein